MRKYPDVICKHCGEKFETQIKIDPAIYGRVEGHLGIGPGNFTCPYCDKVEAYSDEDMIYTPELADEVGRYGKEIGGENIVDDGQVRPDGSGSGSSAPDLARGPRLGAYAEETGAYELAIKQLDDTVNPGGTLQLELFITGYGMIKSPKIAFFPSPTFIDPIRSEVVHSMGQEATSDPKIKRLVFGVDQRQMDAAGCVIGLRGFHAPGWDQSTLVMDYPHPPPTDVPAPLLSTEQVLDQPPITMSLRVARKARRGTHSLKFYMTYFDGQSWRVATSTVTVTVPPFHERSIWNKLLWIIALVTGVVAAAGAAGAIMQAIIQMMR